MNTLIHIGFGNIVNTEKIIAVVSPDSAPVKRMVQHARESGMAIDATQGEKNEVGARYGKQPAGAVSAFTGNDREQGTDGKRRDK